MSFVCYPLALIVGLHVAVCDQEALPVLSCMAGRKEEGEVAFFLFDINQQDQIKLFHEHSVYSASI